MFDMLTRNWWTLALRGLAALFFGVLTLAWPGLSLVVMIALFGAFALVNGVMAMVASYHAHERQLRWGSLLAVGILDVIAAGVTWFWPGLTALALLYVVVAWALMTGILSIGAAIEFHEGFSRLAAGLERRALGGAGRYSGDQTRRGHPEPGAGGGLLCHRRGCHGDHLRLSSAQPAARHQCPALAPRSPLSLTVVAPYPAMGSHAPRAWYHRAWLPLDPNTRKRM